MAGPSNNLCFHCKSATTTFRNGWLLRSGNFAQLCERCGSVYENGTFCETFHLESDGWRDCVACKKMLHCGCIVSDKDIVIMDYGGVCCMDCAKKYLILAKIEHMSLNACHELWKNLRAQSRDRHPKVESSVDSEEPVTETNSGHDSVSSGCSAMPSALSPEKDVQPGSPCKEQTSVLGDNSTANSLGETDTSSESYVDDARSLGVSSGLIHLQHLPKMKEEELLRILGDSNSAIIPLFQKVLTHSDTDPKNGRLVLPKKCAEAYLPEIYDSQGIILKVHDTTGEIWEFNYRFWLNWKSKMYVLEGLRNYMALKEWQPGDIVTFYRIEPEGKLLMGTTKATALPPEL